jgi:hypothetical protein
MNLANATLFDSAKAGYLLKRCPLSDLWFASSGHGVLQHARSTVGTIRICEFQMTVASNASGSVSFLDLGGKTRTQGGRKPAIKRDPVQP